MPNVMHFARVLRTVGLPIGPGRVLDALAAIDHIGLAHREDLYWALHATFVSHPRHRELFDQAFHVFWQNPELLEKMMAMVMPELRVPAREHNGDALNQRLTEALFPDRGQIPEVESEPQEATYRASLTWSDHERLMDMDFDSMNNDEIRQTLEVIKGMDLSVRPLMTRRYQAHNAGNNIDLRATIKASTRHPSVIPLMWRKRRTRPPVLVTLCDISGSMSQYSRMMLHFMHAITSARDRVHSFVFGTRLTNITRHLHQRDVDAALVRVSSVVNDWNGGTRMGQCLADFNRNWSRRVLGQGAIVLLISDGLDRDAGDGLALQMQRLSRSCRRLIWLNPLLRYDGFEPLTLGTQLMLPYVHDFRSIHNLNSMQDLATVLSRAQIDTLSDVVKWRARLPESRGK